METISLQRGIKAIFSLLRITLGIVPIVAGFDKFTNILTNWEQYLNPVLVQILPFSAHTFMMVVGVIEIIAGILVLRRPAIGGYAVAAWLTAIALSLLASFSFVDVAVRDLVMAISAFSLAKMAKLIEN
ncbi:tRNA (5-methylaminomethyl-2-thiouridylate)-methyltransferase [Sphingobacterium sp. ML3W]|uniref:tRNA (5-methylaminomethyl-2-thiouridylate)-methyltransferase n=1 Tax=Sphingobacterium sp. ML3W TaxID=1538644 RepID=UPI0004F7D78B|nr:tRNA (5-methylaminomethyl-2-thiouridylate)-methyltransferase [Sphingobacterium sp. ML3W]AIM38046.1 tRNA (5-methylaminomethyl-2-thiouridylate)-methyltransferase [Sphingobacterium sp. ML3W]